MEARQIGQEARFGVSESDGLCWLERVGESGARWGGLGGKGGRDDVVVMDELESRGVREIS